ncbi:MAG: class I SAM-dependent methyltransferase [Victivallaceae bacterium]|nr:class I SAM-dependent methyltransferase [Victivallaceae bacterium]
MNDEYRLLDSGGLRKLEQVGPYRLVRPSLNAFWRPALDEKEWLAADAELERDAKGNGHWHFRRELPQSWTIRYAGFNLLVKPTAFGHLGFFAEQHSNWSWFEHVGNICALNLFAYSGVGSLALARGGARVTHLDAAQGMVDWGRENLKINPEIPDRIRWIVDDVTAFCRREVRRGNRYNLIALDPPSFGRGNKGQVWKIEDDLIKLLELCLELAEPEKPLKIVLSAHSPGFSALVMRNMLADVFGSGEFAGTEMTVTDSTGRENPSGVCVCYSTERFKI